MEKFVLISYRPFWDYCKSKNISTYKLIYTYGINSYTIDRLRHDKPLKTTTIDDICNRLHIDIPNVMSHQADFSDEFTP